ALDGGRGQQGSTTYLAAIEPEREEACVVRRGRIKGFRAVEEGEQRLFFMVPVFVPQARRTGVIRADPRPRGRVLPQHAEGVLHPQWFEDSLADELIDRLARNLGNDGGEGRRVGVAVAKGPGRAAGTDPAGLVGDVSWTAISTQRPVDERQRKPCRVRQQLLDGDGARLVIGKGR